MTCCKSGSRTLGPEVLETLGSETQDLTQSLKVGPQDPFQNLKVGPQDPFRSLKVEHPLTFL